MKFGINTLLFAASFTDEHSKLFARFKKIGFDGVEIALGAKGDFDCAKTLKALKDNGLVCSSICAMMGEDRDIRGPNAGSIASGLQYIRDVVDTAAALECSLAVGPFYSAVGRANQETPEARKEQWKTVVKNLKEACRYAADKKVFLALEPLNRFETDFMNICRDAMRMIEEVGSDALKIHLDTFHMNVEEKSSAQAVLDAGKLLYHIHASENDRGAPGTGQVPWKPIADAARKIGYDKWVVIESFTPENKIIAKAASIWRQTEKDDFTLAEKGLKFLRQTFK